MTKQPAPMELCAEGSMGRSRRILVFVGVVLFLQAQLLVLTSLVRQQGAAIAEPHFFGMDFRDFLTAADDWLSGVNPYSYFRFNKPPLTLLLGLGFRPLGFAVARDVFFLTNIVIVLAAVWSIGKWLGFARSERWLLLSIASLYYPFLFLLERGNLDGLMLGLVAIFLCSRSTPLRIAALAVSINLKVYTALLLVPLALKRRREALLVAGASAVLLLPFWRLVVSAGHLIGTRDVLLSTVENVSPGGFLANIAAHHPVLRLVYMLLWVAGYAAMLYRRRAASPATLAILSLAWTVAYPLTVIPYTALMLLPVLALRVREMAVKAALTWVDQSFLAGFLLTGTQQYALFVYYGAAIHSHQFFPGLNYLGTTLLLLSLVLQQEPAQVEAEMEPAEDRIPPSKAFAIEQAGRGSRA